MIILPLLPTSLIHFLFKGWENVLFELRNERVIQHDHDRSKTTTTALSLGDLTNDRLSEAEIAAKTE